MILRTFKKHIPFVILSCIMGLSQKECIAQETSIKLDPIKMLVGGLGFNIEQQLRPRSSAVGSFYFYGNPNGTGLLSDCGGTSLELAFRNYFAQHKKGGLRGLYIGPGFTISNANCDNFLGGTSSSSINPSRFLFDFDFGYQAIGKGGFTFDINLGLGFLLSGDGDGTILRGGLAFGYTFGEILLRGESTN